ncbi:CDP-alcohol phosphatidyltransferase family protein [Methylobrevis pamukkalensis]|uniref:CDP-diacylglycerol--glycerol-3-phosphate 3-phosphatidyltransferase n=1 Tax=Methylobrevis pamukkalensis TaxID=1439726 RepID=A0A1E3H0R7_9HYPH|nr:CDP-alcohol phosphatidyltransferase family protein [Methylobrevis pamukkalensis]ODN69909.1 putative CDP-diacylglycerol--glycerol-3-phosphate 3-phosphatidyl-transferase 2 [Methylobrevis pamukkalensis]
MTIPNIIALLRLVAVPFVILLMIEDRMDLAFLLFVAAGISDAVDGIIARHFDQMSELGAYLDPIADKALLMSIYGTLGYLGVIPAWLVVLVFSRDVLIVGGVVLSWIVGRPVAIEPLMISKANTAAQIAVAALVLAVLAFDWDVPVLVALGTVVVAVLTITSAGAYLVSWARHMGEPAGRE